VDIGLDDGLAALERGQRHGGSSRRHVAAVAVDPGLEAEFGDLGLEIGREADAREALAGRNEVVTQRLDLAGVLRSRIGSAASAAVGLERAVDDLDAVVDLATALDGGPESEAISQLGRRSPSSGFIVPMRVKLAGWEMLMPSRSTVLTPFAAESRITSTRWSSSRLTSST